MVRITDDDIKSYRLINTRYDTEEEVKEELQTWNKNTALKMLQDGMYKSHKGIILDVPFDVLLNRITIRKLKVTKGKNISESDIWGIPSKQTGIYHSGELLDSGEPLVELEDVEIGYIIDFLSYYLFDTTSYAINNTDIDEHAYRIESRYFNVKFLLDEATKGEYFITNNLDREDVEERIVKGYKGLMEYHYGEEDTEKGLRIVTKFINKKVSR